MPPLSLRPVHWCLSLQRVLCPLYITSDFKPQIFTLSPIVYLTFPPTKILIPSRTGFIPPISPTCPLAISPILPPKYHLFVASILPPNFHFLQHRLTPFLPTKYSFYPLKKKPGKRERKPTCSTGLCPQGGSTERGKPTAHAPLALSHPTLNYGWSGDSLESLRMRLFWGDFRGFLVWFASFFVWFWGFLGGFGVFFFSCSAAESLGGCSSWFWPPGGSSDSSQAAMPDLIFSDIFKPFILFNL